MLKRLAFRTPAAIAWLLKRLGVHLRYLAQRRACRTGFSEFGDDCPQDVLVIAGLPKSGPTWLKKMLNSYLALHHVQVPNGAFVSWAILGHRDPRTIGDRLVQGLS